MSTIGNVVTIIYASGFFFFLSHCWHRFKITEEGYENSDSERRWGTIFSALFWPIYFPFASAYRYFSYNPKKK